MAIVGCGTSWFIGQAYAVLRETAGLGETDAFAASEFPAGRAYDHVLALSRSGTTTEVHSLLAKLRGRTRTTAITVLQQCDTPIGLFVRPVNLFVAGFIGSPAMNLLETTVDGPWSVPLTPARRSALTGPGLVVGVRSEGWTIDSGADAVEVVEELGSDQYLYCRADSQVLTVRTPGMSPWQRGEPIKLAPKPDAVHLFGAATGDRLP